ncbi:MAG: VWA domain-containing protein [Parcubacteria group bacterium]|nr:VWA domain-containing protein [Parcubacteria group bacterium]
MISWSTKRRLLYTIIPLAILFVISYSVFFFFWYKAPTCNDRVKNGGETGVDCGGSCQRICSFETLDPVILWSRVFRVTSNTYNAVAYIENHNINSQAENVPYVFKVKNEKGEAIVSKEGKVYIPKNKSFAIFESNIEVPSGEIPKTTTFEFTSLPIWIKNTEPTSELFIKKKVLSRQDSSPRIDVTFENRSIETIKNIEVVALVLDGKNNAIGASRTFIDSLDKNQSKDVVFTWPEPFVTQSGVCKTPVDVMLLVDRSGSMASDGSNPPQPLTDVKNGAISFVQQLNLGDKVGLISFATMPSNPIDALLNSDFSKTILSISNIDIGKDGTQYTNLGDTIIQAVAELSSLRHTDIAHRVIVALTDGIMTYPEKIGDKNYPVTYTLSAANQAKASGISVYSIGLGNEVDSDFLQNISSASSTYFAVADSKNLKDIYRQIALDICVDSPAVIEIIPRVIPR